MQDSCPQGLDLDVSGLEYTQKFGWGFVIVKETSLSKTVCLNLQGSIAKKKQQ